MTRCKANTNAGDPSAYYVYILSDPRSGQPFYVGKGSGRRYRMHGPGSTTAKGRRIRDIRTAGMVAEAVVVEAGLPEQSALRRERELIDAIGLESLDNVQPGTTTESERLLAFAQDARQRIKPYRQWVSEAPRTEMDKELYRGFVRTIDAICDGERPGEVELSG